MMHGNSNIYKKNNIDQLSNFKTFSVKLIKFIYCKLALLFSLLVIRVSEHNFNSSHRSLFAPKILLCLEKDGAQSVHTLCSVALFLAVYILGFPLPVLLRQSSILV